MDRGIGAGTVAGEVVPASTFLGEVDGGEWVVDSPAIAFDDSLRCGQPLLFDQTFVHNRERFARLSTIHSPLSTVFP
jgi:hypothetical protein